MTRLKENDISQLGISLAAYDRLLCDRAGVGLAGIAAHATEKECGKIDGLLRGMRVAAVPITYGQGVISGFSRAVQNIVEFLGASCFVTDRTSLQGLAEAVEKRADVIFLADDDYFLALRPSSGVTAENSAATGYGYGAALDLMSGGVNKRDVLVLGAGPVGQAAVGYLCRRGARVHLLDPDLSRTRAVVAQYPSVQTAGNILEAMERCDLILEATPAEKVIPLQAVTERTIIAAPGVPLGFDEQVEEALTGRFVHDVLEIGVATMLYTVLID
ncbi:MAG: 3-methylornithyl-N6-L-lysine dehydrogenase PylD [Desulforhopalus sp.]|nr:3-methylornithyl-N6-L-lysine dehydrogenase PylD [Desulforhopalus sp.]